MHSKISHMCRNVIMKMKTTNNLISKLFNPPSTSSAKAFGSLFCAGTRHFYLVSSPQGLGIVFALSICVAFCCKHILSICMKYIDQFVNHNVNLYLTGLSFDKHFSFLSKHDKSRVFYIQY